MIEKSKARDVHIGREARPGEDKAALRGKPLYNNLFVMGQIGKHVLTHHTEELTLEVAAIWTSPLISIEIGVPVLPLNWKM